jgi:hypothetical protein
MVYMQGDPVQYVGSKFNDLLSAVGFVVSAVDNDPGKYVVEFGPDAYVMSHQSIAPYRPNGKEDKSLVVPVRRRRSEDDE